MPYGLPRLTDKYIDHTSQRLGRIEIVVILRIVPGTET